MIEEKIITDWRELIPLVQPFYERFFEESFPEDLKVALQMSESKPHDGDIMT